jgi:FSR family fosmidomycin resistance protein-like MFS transporter
LFVTWLVGAYGLAAMPYSLWVGLPAMVFLIAVVPVTQAEGFGDLGLAGSVKMAFGRVWKPVAIVWVIMTLRAYVSQSFLTYLPIWAAREGHSLISVGAIVACYTIAGAFSGIVAGHLSDRMGFKPIFYAAHLLAVPSIYLLMLVPGFWIYVHSFLCGFFLLATLPVGLALAQRIAPKGKSMVSSLMMGLSWGTGGIMTPLTGSLADVFGIRPVLLGVALVSLATMVLVRYLPEPLEG